MVRRKSYQFLIIESNLQRHSFMSLFFAMTLLLLILNLLRKKKYRNKISDSIITDSFFFSYILSSVVIPEDPLVSLLGINPRKKVFRGHGQTNSHLPPVRTHVANDSMSPREWTIPRNSLA